MPRQSEKSIASHVACIRVHWMRCSSTMLEVCALFATLVRASAMLSSCCGCQDCRIVIVHVEASGKQISEVFRSMPRTSGPV